MKALVWLQNDLRIHDNTALYNASQLADKGLVAVYFITPKIWHKHDMAACRVEFILQNLEKLSIELEKLNISLLIFQAENFVDIQKQLITFAKKIEADTLFYNQQYEVNEKTCADEITKEWKKKIGNVFLYEDQLILPPGNVLTNENKFYHVFTPFKNKWQQIFKEHGLSVLSKPKKQAELLFSPSNIPKNLEFVNEIKMNYWRAGEREAKKQLSDFIENKIELYEQTRDFPAEKGTSKLSVYLALGVLSARQCLHELLVQKKTNSLEKLSAGAKVWVNELIWREFYKTILFAYPRLSMHQPFKLETKNIPWDNNEKLFEAWKNGQTGFPFVDAGMRQLRQTSWMHNRLRMVTAMFLCKTLFIDWRWGEKYFMQHLIDGDLAANNGGWQWSASTGTDAVPYFRIFNPTTQSQRFDPNGDFIRQYCPELKELDNKEIHAPSIESAKKCNYPTPIIQHGINKEKIMTSYRFCS
jgi:deoxyribodipyrimidine photo-lyase